MQDDNSNVGAARSDEMWSQRMRVPLVGYVIDPRVLVFQFAAAPTFTQGTSDFSNRPRNSQNLSYDLSSSLFSRRRLSFTYRIAQAKGLGRGSFGLRTDSESASLGVSARFRHRYFPILASYSDFTALNRWSGGGVGVPIESERRITTSRAEMSNGKLRVTLEQVAIDDRIDSQDQIRTSANFDHRLRWGRRSTLNSVVRFEGRRGRREASVFLWNERARITHTETASTQLFMTRQRWNGLEGDLRVASAGGSTQLRPRPWLSTQLGLSRRNVRAGDGVENGTFQVTPTVQFSHRTESGWRGGLSIVVGLLGQSREGLSEDSWIEVLAEEQRIRESLTFELAQQGVDSASVEIWADDSSVRYLEGIDYILVLTGGRVEVRVLPGGRIEEGDVVLVSYRFRSAGRVQGMSSSFSVSGSVGNSFVTLDFGQRQESGNPITESEFLPQTGTAERWAGLSFEFPPSFLGDFRLDADHRERTLGDARTTSDEIRAVWGLPFRGRFTSRVRGGLVRHRDEVAKSVNATASMDMGWIVSRSVRVDGGASVYDWSRAGTDPERYLSGNLSVSWEWGLFTTRLQANRNVRSNGIRLESNRWDLNVTRIF